MLLILLLLVFVMWDWLTLTIMGLFCRVIHERFDGLCWVCFDSGLDDLCYDVFIKLLMILSEHWCETSVMTFDTLDNLFLMFL